MSASENALLSLLFEEGRVLENLKFFPGNECASADELFDAAHTALRMSFESEVVDMVPASVRPAMSIGDLVKSF